MSLVFLLFTVSCPWAISKDQKKQPTIPSSPRLTADGQQATANRSPKFLPDDPIWVDPDRLSIPKPQRIELSQIYDFLENTFADPGGSFGQRARNINTLGEVPDSSWFTNRIGLHPMTVEELVRGPNRGEGPDKSRPWTIIKAKTEGITPGFIIRDGRGDIYFIKFDPLQYPQMATSTEVISTKFFYAFGYNVPENYLAFLQPNQLEIDPEVTVVDEEGKKKKMTLQDVADLLKKVPKRSDGTIQVLASLKLPGEPLGPFKYYGTRSDDPNDIFPHEDRRELRGLRVFAAWLNHNDSRSINSLDMYVTEEGRSYVKHYLIDFGATLGSASVKPNARREGFAYFLEWGPIWKSALTLGFKGRPWQHIKYPNYPEIGRFEATFFQPERWKPNYPNPAFIRMQNEDAFWATRTVMRFSDEAIRAIVKTGQISNPEAENYLIETLIRRRDKIIQYYLNQINPLDDFQVNGETQTLNFKNLGIEAQLAPVEAYEYQWFRFDNQQGSLEPLSPIQRVSSPSLPLPQDNSPYLMVRIRTLSRQANWRKKVEVFIRNNSNKKVVGLEREN
jgi:hypothetical protein